MRFPLLFLWVLVIFVGAPLGAFAQERTFRRTLTLEVPARGLLGDPPTREMKELFEVPEGFSRSLASADGGIQVFDKNLGGMAEKSWKLTPKPNGVEVSWELANEECFPVGGRAGFVVIELKATRSRRMVVSTRYQVFRARFLSDFYYKGLTAESVELVGNSRKLTFSDQTLYMGLALAVFATEMAVQRDAGLDTKDTRNLAKQILEAFDDLDRGAEAYFGGAAAQLDGCFIRDDIKGVSDPRLAGQGTFARVDSDWQHRAEADAAPSGDQIFGMMVGLYCIVRFSGDQELIDKAKAVSSRLYDYAKRNFFELRVPGDKHDLRGADLRWLATLLHGMNASITGQDLFTESRIRIAGNEFKLNAIGTLWSNEKVQKLIADNAGKEFAPALGLPKIKLNAFAMHLLLMALAPADVWPQEAVEKTALSCNHQAAALLYAAAHHRLPLQLSRQTVQEILGRCPQEGPNGAAPVSSGWQKDCRWVRCLDLKEQGSGKLLFNGLDWMLLHNLDQIVFQGP